MKKRIVTIGESMLRLAAAPGRSLENSEHLALDIAGAESNVAIGLSRLGLESTWISQLINNPFGRRIASTLRAQGVDVSHILWTEHGRVGVYYIELGSPPRSGQVIYDRADSAVTRIDPDSVNWNALDGADMLHLTGITPALSPNCKALVQRSLKEAKKRNVPISFDINFRSRLWSATAARECLLELLPEVSLLFCGKGDAATVFEIKGEAVEVAQELARLSKAQLVVLTESSDGAVAVENGQVFQASALGAQVVDRIGAGDAFVAGFLCGYLEKGIEWGLRYGVVNAGLKLSYYGDINWSTREEIEQHIQGVAARNWR